MTATSHISSFPAQWAPVLHAAKQGFAAQLTAIGAPDRMGRIKGAAVVRQFPDRAVLASICWHKGWQAIWTRFGYPYQLVIALAPTRSFSSMIAATDIAAWVEAEGIRAGSRTEPAQALDKARADWPALGFRTTEDAVEFLQRIGEARQGFGYREGVLYPKRLDGSTSIGSLLPSAIVGTGDLSSSLQPVPAASGASPIALDPLRLRASTPGGNRRMDALAISMFDVEMRQKIQMQAALMDLLRRPDVEDARKVRVGQMLLRRSLMQLHKSRCQVTGISVRNLLRCSHIKPWAQCTRKEQLDLDNCLLLSPHWDAAFDSGLISFERDGSLVLGSELQEKLADVQALFGQYNRLNIAPSSRQAEYLSWHRAEVLK